MILVLAALIVVSPIVDANLRQTLKDYDSAKIEAVAEPREIPWRVRCGFLSAGCVRADFPVMMHCYRVNAKNSYGGYTGWRFHWFAVHDDKVVSSGDDRYNLARYCGSDPGPSQN